jgi:hypothetical protein
MTTNSTLNPAATGNNPIPTPAPKKRSGGPKTPEGKARSAQNALKHGAYAVKYPVLKTESLDAYQAHTDCYFARFAPNDEVEKNLVADLALIQWNLHRIAVWEAQAIDSQIDALHNSPFTPGANGQSERTTIAVGNALQQPGLDYFARRHSSLIRARTATLKALADLRRNHPVLDNAPFFLPDPLMDPETEPETAPEPEPGPEPAAAPSPSPILLPPFPPAHLQNMTKRTPPLPASPLAAAPQNRFSSLYVMGPDHRLR